MAKELPYFKFEPAEYLTKNISFCSLPAQGLFANICCYYWQRGCTITKEQILRRLNYPNELQELISEGILDLVGENISIKFLDRQLESAIEISQKNSQNGSKGGRPKKKEETQKKPTALFSETQTKAIRKDNIRKEDKKIEERINNSPYGDGRLHFLCVEFERANKGKYVPDFYKDFLEYWTAKIQKGAAIGKERWTDEKTFSLGQRLSTSFKLTWQNKNNFKNNVFPMPTISVTPKPAPTIELTEEEKTEMRRASGLID
jgi:hypothetical protein